MFKLRRNLIGIAILGFSSIVSCEKTHTIENQNEIQLKPIDNFTVTLNSNGQFITNDENFINSNPRISRSLSMLSTSFTGLKTSSNVSLTIDKKGVIISEDKYYNNRLFTEVLINEGKLNYFEKDFTVVFDNNGYKSISDKDIYTLYPQLKQDFIDAGANFINKIPNNKEISISFKGNKFFVNGNEFPLFSKLNTTKGHYYDEFRDCVGFYWWLPGVNVVACGAGAIIAWAIDYDGVRS